MTKNQHRVVWTKGMFLTPQHFQTQDQYFENSLHFRFSATNYANWGVSALSVDTEALANGLFRLLECRGIMPDGLAFHMPAAEELPPSRQVAAFFPPSEREMDVFLAIPEQRLEAANVTIPASAGASPGAAGTRYTAETRTIADENSGVEGKEVQTARGNFRLLFGGEYRDGFTSLRIAQVTRNAAGAYVLQPAFIAPCLDIAHSAYLMGLLRRQIEILATKSSTLSSLRSQRGGALAELAGSETASWLLYTVNSHLPELRHIWKVRHGHPEHAYVAMLRLAGALSTLSLKTGLDDLPDYDHDNLGSCFSRLDACLRDLVEMALPTKCVSVPLALGERHVWTGSVPDDRYFRDSQFYLAIHALMDAGELIQKVPRSIKIASRDDIDRLIDKALAGIGLTYTPAPPAAIPMKLNNQYFSLSQVGPLWEKVMLSRSLAAYAPSEIKDPKMEILIVLE